MGFALPTLSSFSFLRLAHGIRLTATAMESAMPLAQAPACQPLPAAAPEPANVISFSKARRRSQQRRGKAARAADPGDAQLILPLLPTQPALQAAPEQSSGLRIIQRSPQEQPECLFISGRMADVCAALERLEAHGGAAAN